MSHYIYAPYIKTTEPIPSVAVLIESHDKWNTIGTLAWFTDRDTLSEHLKYNDFSEEELHQIIDHKPKNVSHRGLVEAALYIDFLCDMLNLERPAWLEDEDTMIDLRAPMFGKYGRQKFIRNFLRRTHGTKTPFVRRGCFKEYKDYGVI